MTLRTKSVTTDLKSLGQNLYDQILSLKVGTRNEEINFKLFKECEAGQKNDELLAEGKFAINTVIK